jgi:ribosomal protein S27E
MTDDDMRLDGNAAAGMLSEVFKADMTTAVGTCASCGMTGPLGAALVYMAAGTVVRCPKCSALLMTVTRARERLFVEAAGVRLLQMSG